MGELTAEQAVEAVNVIEEFIADYKSAPVADVANKWGLNRTVVGNGVALLNALGFNVETKTGGRGAALDAVEFDREFAALLHDRGASVRDIAAFLTKRDGKELKPAAVTHYLKSVGKIASKADINEIVKDLEQAA
jgi:hypothetical protein